MRRPLVLIVLALAPGSMEAQATSVEEPQPPTFVEEYTKLLGIHDAIGDLRKLSIADSALELRFYSIGGSVTDAAGANVLVERSTSDIVRAATLRLGTLDLQNVTLASYDELDVDGVLGYNVLQHASFTLDFPGQRLVLHRLALPPPNGRDIHSYVVQGRLPYLLARVGSDSLLLNLDTGAGEVMTVPSAFESRLRWRAPPTAGRATFNNQTGRTVVREGRLADTVLVGDFVIPQPLVFINSDAEDAWFGAAAMNRGRWTFDPRQRRLQIELP